MQLTIVNSRLSFIDATSYSGCFLQWMFPPLYRFIGVSRLKLFSDQFVSSINEAETVTL